VEREAATPRTTSKPRGERNCGFWVCPAPSETRENEAGCAVVDRGRHHQADAGMVVVVRVKEELAKLCALAADLGRRFFLGPIIAGRWAQRIFGGLKKSSGQSVAYQVVLADAAKADANRIYDWVVERAPIRGPEWFERLIDRLYSLEEFPYRCPCSRSKGRGAGDPMSSLW
jgi:hypothetical protein